MLENQLKSMEIENNHRKGWKWLSVNEQKFWINTIDKINCKKFNEPFSLLEFYFEIKSTLSNDDGRFAGVLMSYGNVFPNPGSDFKL